MNDKMRFEVRFIACTWNYYSMISWLIMHHFSWFKINFNYFYVVMQFIAYENKIMIWSKKSIIKSYLICITTFLKIQEVA